MRIIHITDMHLSVEGLGPFDMDSRTSFCRVRRELHRERPDLVVVGGDLTYPDNDLEAANLLRVMLEKDGFSYRVIAGNHDNPAMLNEVFGTPKTGFGAPPYCWVERFDGRDLIFLDTSGERLSETTLAWLSGLGRDLSEGPLVFMHHPPAEMGIKYMDRHHAMADLGRAAAALALLGPRVHVFAGHYHGEALRSIGGLTVYTTPATSFQVADEPTDLVIEKRIAGYRRIDVDGTGVDTEAITISLD